MTLKVTYVILKLIADKLDINNIQTRLIAQTHIDYCIIVRGYAADIHRNKIQRIKTIITVIGQ